MKQRFYILKDKEFVPVESSVWVEWFDDIESRRIAYTRLGPRVTVSTVAVGLLDPYYDAPVFETAIYDEESWNEVGKSLTWGEALEAHNTAVKQARTYV